MSSSVSVFISTHTLTWSVTLLSKDISVYSLHFNSHAHVERDDDMLTCVFEVINFNSHAHVERDFVYLLIIFCGLNFNSHAHVERDWF